MADDTTDTKALHAHLDGIKAHLEGLKQIAPGVDLAALTVRFGDAHEMMVCVPDPNDPEGVICR